MDVKCTPTHFLVIPLCFSLVWCTAADDRHPFVTKILDKKIIFCFELSATPTVQGYTKGVTIAECPKGLKLCHSHDQCIFEWQICNGKYDCWDRSDESDCCKLSPIYNYIYLYLVQCMYLWLHIGEEEVAMLFLDITLNTSHYTYSKGTTWVINL